MINLKIEDIIKSDHCETKLNEYGFSLIHSIENWNDLAGTLEIWEHISEKIWIVVCVDSNRVDLIPHKTYGIMAGDTVDSVLAEYQ